MTVSTEPKPESPAELAAEAKRLVQAYANAETSEVTTGIWAGDSETALERLHNIVDRLAALATIQASAAPLARPVSGEAKPLTEEQLFRLIEQSGAPYRKPVQQVNRFTGEEETVFIETEEFSEFKFARLIERAHGIAAPTSTPSAAKKD